MIGRSTIFASAMILAAAAPAAAVEPYTAIYSFGDSLSDAGNVYNLTGGLAPASPYSNGRYSNGNVWAQDLANILGLGPLTASLNGGTDYAYGGATTGFSVPSPVPNITQQVDLYLVAHPVASSTALYTFSIGANDLFSILGSGDTPSEALAAAAGAAGTEASAAAALFGKGARNLVVFDVPDLGSVPYITQFGKTVEQAATALSAFYDAQLFADLAPLENQGLKVYDLNTFTLLDNVAADPSAYGFNNVTAPCYTGPFTGGGSACSDPDSYLFWDQVHPTAAAHLIIGTEAANLVLGLPEPSTWAMMLTGFAALGFAGFRRRREQASAQA
jgi:phospholipase/lecithinase/hemolysin